MRYEYTVTKEGGEAEIMREMSWKKLFKSLLLKYPKFSGWCTYINKKDTSKSEALIMEKKLKIFKRPTHCVLCGCTPKPDEWSIVAENCCFDCA